MTIRALGLSIALAGSLAGPALADDYRGTQDDQDACTADVFRLCSDLIPNEAPIVKCLIAKGDQLSPACHHVFFSSKPSAPPPTDANTDAPVADATAGSPPEHHKRPGMHHPKTKHHHKPAE